MIVFTLYTMVDGFFVARYVGELALSSVNIAMPFINGLFGIAILFSVGTQTLVGVKLGEGKKEEANKIFSFVTASLFVLCVLLTGLSAWFIKDIALFLGATNVLINNVLIYLSIIIWFSSCFIISYNFEVMVKIDGFPLLATLSVVISAITNIVLDYIFVGIMNKGVAGAALATGISQAISIFIYLYHFLFGKSNLHFVRFRPKFKLFRTIFAISFGDFIAEIGVGIVIFLYNHFLLLYLGELAVASFTVIGYINQIVCMCYVGIMQGIQPLTSYYLGKNEPQTYNQLFKYAFRSTIILGVICCALIYFTAPDICNLFFQNTTQNFITTSSAAMRSFSIVFIFSGFNILVAGFSSALMRPRYAIFINLMRNLILLAAALYLIGTYAGSQYLWYAAAIAEFATLLFSAIFLKKLWKIKN